MTQLAAGGSHSLALKNDGSVYSFGSNSRGLLGLGKLWPGKKVANKHCSSNKASEVAYSTRSEAEAACQSNAGCTGIYDESCDNSGNWFQCNAAAYATSGSSCIFTAAGRRDRKSAV